MAIATKGFTYVKDFKDLDAYITKRQRDMDIAPEIAPFSKAVTYLLWIGFSRFDIPKIYKNHVLSSGVYDAEKNIVRKADMKIVSFLDEYAQMEVFPYNTPYLIRTKRSGHVTEEILRSRMRVMNQLSDGGEGHYDMTAIYNCGRWYRVLEYERMGGTFPLYRRNRALSPEDLKVYNNIFDIEMEDTDRVTREVNKYTRWKQLMNIYDPV